jgi:polyphosphate kinase
MSATAPTHDSVAARYLPDFAVPRATSPRSVPDDGDLSHPHLFFNRELSWLDFNWRVLAQAMDPRIPLLERVRFLAISYGNLDEFFRKRVGGLKRQAAAGVKALSPDGRNPLEQLSLIRGAASAMHVAVGRTWHETLVPALDEALGIRIESVERLSSSERKEIDSYFRSHVFPILTPLAVDPGHPFPFISNLSLSLAVTLRHPARHTEHFARIKVPTTRGRWIRIGSSNRYVPLEEVIRANVGELFRGMEVRGVSAFRISRNADIGRNEEEADDLLEMISEELRERRFAQVVRLEVEEQMESDVREMLCHELQLSEEDVYQIKGMLDYSDLGQIANLDFPDHRYKPWDPVIPSRLLHEGETNDRVDMFEVIRHGDLMVHHPYESFRASVQRFVEEAAADPKVIAIKQTLYRTSEESPVIKALVRAAERGKQVAVLVEVKARFDEESNMEWGQMLEKSGVHVTYGLIGLKTHSKATLVMREEADGPRAYCHLGTGNYHPTTASLYSDIGLFTCDEEITSDVINLFHYLTGYAPQQHYQTILVAPRDLRKAFVAMIEREIEHHKAGRGGRIIAKMNALDDVEMISELYRASQAGVEIDLVIRGHCRLRPGLPGFSDRIRVRSIVGRFLEHSRMYFFQNGDDPEVFIGSADWQRRNLEERVETIVPVRDAELRSRLQSVLFWALHDRRDAWELGPDGRYVQLTPGDESEADSGFQEVLMKRIAARTLAADAPWDVG